MRAAELTIERFPTWTTRSRRAATPRTDWISLGSEHDIAHVVRLWQHVLRFRLDQLPDDEHVMWQVADKLRGRGSRVVRIRDGVLDIDRRHLHAFREAIDWLWDHLCDEHGDHRYAWCRDVGEWIRIETEVQPITDFAEARLAVEIIESIMDVAADNVVKIRETA